MKMYVIKYDSDILKLRFENGEWQEFGDEYDRIIA